MDGSHGFFRIVFGPLDELSVIYDEIWPRTRPTFCTSRTVSCAGFGDPMRHYCRLPLNEPARWQPQGLLRLQRVLEAPQQATTTFDGRSVVNLSSNNYLGLTTHPLLKARAIKAIEDFGVGSGILCQRSRER